MKIMNIYCDVKLCSYNIDNSCERNDIDLFVNDMGIVKCHSVDYTIANKAKKELSI